LVVFSVYAVCASAPFARSCRSRRQGGIPPDYPRHEAWREGARLGPLDVPDELPYNSRYLVAKMPRRPDSQRLYDAHRAGPTQRLIREAQLSQETADRWVAQWQTEASLRGLDRHRGTFRAPAWEWIAEQRLR
jgi:hypothetical protein